MTAGHRFSRGWRRARRMHPALAFLLALTLAQGIAWIAATGPLQGPDEAAHFSYVQHLAETGKGPQRDAGAGSQSTEVDRLLDGLNLNAILGHLEAKPSWADAAAVQRRLDALPDSARKNGSGPNAAANNGPLYYAYGALAYRLSPDTSVLARIAAVRLAGVLLLLVTVGLAWLAAAELFAGTWPRVVAAGLVATQPKLGFMAAVVNPDILLVALTTALVLVALRLVRRGVTPWRVIGVALLAGAGVMTQGRGLALVPPAAVAVLVALARFRPGWGPAARAMLPAAVAGGLCALVAMRWTSSHTGGGAFGGQATLGGAAFSVKQLLSTTWQFYFSKLGFMAPRPGPAYGYRQVFVETGFGAFGSLEVNYRPAIYDAIQLAAALGLVALYTAVVVRWRAVRARWPEVVVAVATVGSLLALLHINSYQSLLNGPDPVMTGRYLLPCVALYGAAAAFVCRSLPPRLGPALGAILLGASALLSVGGIAISLERFYA